MRAADGARGVAPSPRVARSALPPIGKPHYRLEAWKQAMALVTEVYRLTSTLPSEEKYGLAAQMRRAAVSVPSNIAEGAARETRKEFAQFLTIARGSLSALETQLLSASNLGYLHADKEVHAVMQRVSRLLTGLLRSARR
ncbi:MAG: four helix bundle protein [Burkholderiales bacterium]|nr:four helix bundle protein [Burkholderiales bacterium]